MTIVWSKRTADHLYEVRTAGKSVRLYTNGIFHSQWNPSRLLTHSVWDSLSMSAFFIDATKLKRVLILGVGGGIVIKQLNALFPGVKIVGVELDPVHISIAKKWFEVGRDDAKLIHADARQWLQNYRGPKFDLIVDDLFGDTNGELTRAIEIDDHWSNCLCERLSVGGVLVVNFIGDQELKKSGLWNRKQFRSRHRFTPPYCENAVSVFVDNETTLKQWQQRIWDHDGLTNSQKQSLLESERKSF